jgi:hypothetical protein
VKAITRPTPFKLFGAFSAEQHQMKKIVTTDFYTLSGNYSLAALFFQIGLGRACSTALSGGRFRGESLR